jgi:glucoamylase
MSSRAIVIALAFIAVAAPAAQAKDPAPGAPGAKHAWAPADKHGFGTATRLRSNVWFTLRSAEMTEAYYPDLGTPSLRSLEFVVSDGTFVDRETGPGVRSSVRAEGLTFVQTTRTRRWVLRKTWITDPRRPTVLCRVLFRSLTGGPLRVFVLVDPAPGDDGNDDLGLSLGSDWWRATTRWPPPSPPGRGCGTRRAATRAARAIPGTTSRPTARSTARSTRHSPATSCRPPARA